MLDMGQKVSFYPLYLNAQQTPQNMGERGAGEKSEQGCWTLMTCAEKVLLFLLILAIFGLVALSAFIILHFLNERSCETHECIKASSNLLKTIDFNVNPCDDFRKYMCANTQKSDERKVDLVTDDLHEDDSGVLSTVKKFYQACTNTSTIEDDFGSTLSKLISRIGGWPLLMGKEWDEDNFNWQRFMTDVRVLGVRSDWVISFDYYEDETGTNLLLISPPKLKPTSYQFKRSYYKDCVSQLADALEGSQFILGQLDQMIEFENNLSSIHEKTHKGGVANGDYSRYTVSKLNGIWPENLFSDILNSLARGYAVFTNNTYVVVESEYYVYELQKLLARVPRRTQANYFIWKIVETFIPFSTDDILEIYTRYFESDSREDLCHAETIRRFHSVVEEEYISKYKSGNTLPLLNSITNLVYKNYKRSDNIRSEVVIEGPEGLNSGVTTISFITNNIMEMINQVQFHIENAFYSCLHRKSETCVKEGYYEDIEKLEPYFDISDNTMHLPYNLVYSESFMWDQPNYINFAKIGRTIADKIIEAEEKKFNRSISVAGVNVAYESYEKWLQINGLEHKLPVLNYTIKQLFWIHSCSQYCASENDSEKFDEAVNSQYFKDDFRCQ